MRAKPCTRNTHTRTYTHTHSSNAVRGRAHCDLTHNLQDLHFVSSPHELPLSPGQSVAMRSWWRHWNLPTHDQDESEQGQEEDSDEGQDGAPKSVQPGILKQNGSAARSVTAPAAPAAAPPAGWDEVVAGDWRASLAALAAEWRAAGPFDGLLGFSNGAAAALLLACHAVSDPVRDCVAA